MTHTILSNGKIRLVLMEQPGTAKTEHNVQRIEMNAAGGWKTVVSGISGAEFSTTLGSMNATACKVARNASGEWTALLSGMNNEYEAEERITLATDKPIIF
ncbi:MAG: hypothetical protein HY360_25540 [Verrucomicrobia bacterium]|nr:hypothetical protein [Verrucomicrobiota bacterium]